MYYNTGNEMPVKKVVKKSTKTKLGNAPELSAGWTFLSNHTHVLVCLANDGDIKVRDIAVQVGITERAVMRILSELEASGVVTREREGRRNRYQIDQNLPLRHALEAHCTIGDILRLVNNRRIKTKA
jgi:DNA-binding transcriptional ArsR family regulator